MFTKIFHRFYGKQSQHQTARNCRRLQLELLEPRELLSVNPLTYSSPYQNTNAELCVLPVMEQNEVAAAAQSVESIPQAAPPAALNETFLLHSKADSHFTIYLDFNGHTTTGTSWNSTYNRGNDFVTPAYSIDSNSNFSNTELERIQYIWQRVAEDFAPFNVDVTTEEPEIERLKKAGIGDTDWGVRVVIGGNSSDWLGAGAGGVAYLGSFNWGTDTPCFVFPNNLGNGSEKSVAEAISHEVGHTLGLSHDGTNAQGDDSYYQGANGWAPIMGVGYSYELVQWSKGEYADANEPQDDLAIITGSKTTVYTPYGNGFTYRNDDHANSKDSATLLTGSDTTFAATGIIEQNTDVDFFQFELIADSIVDLNIISGTRDANLDILAKLYSSTSVLLQTLNPQDTLNASILALTLAAGIYYLSIEGTGKDGVYSDYGSIGTYTFTINASIAPPVAPANFTAVSQTQDSVTLSWNAQSNLTGYILEYKKSSDNDWTTGTVPNTSAKSATITGLTADTAYDFRICAINEWGTSNWSEIKNVKTSETPLLPSPQNLRVTQSAQTTLALDWNNVDGATEYVLQRKNGSVYETIYIGTESKYIDRNLTANTQYEYHVQAKSDNGNSDYATLTAKTATVTDNNGVDSPMFLETTKNESQHVTLQWTNLGNDYTYVLYKAGRVVVNFGSNNSYTDTKPPASGVEGYALLAYNKNTEKFSSVTMSVVWTTAQPLEITGHKVSPDGKITLLWDAEPGVSYNIFRAGKNISGQLTFSGNAGSWTDNNPQANNDYMLVAIYNDGTTSRSTFSNIYTLKKPTSSQAAALDTFWAEYDGVTVDDDVLNAIV